VTDKKIQEVIQLAKIKGRDWTKEMVLHWSSYIQESLQFEPVTEIYGLLESVINNKQMLVFGDNDLVYGPSANTKLEEFKKKCGGKLLADLYSPYDHGYENWVDCSLKTIEKWHERNLTIHFDLTNMQDIPNILKNIGEFADTVTSHELRYIRDNWSRLKNTIRFYKYEREVEPPWKEKQYLLEIEN